MEDETIETMGNVETGTEDTQPQQNQEQQSQEQQKGDDKKYSDKDVDAIINKKFAKWQKEHESKLTEAQKLAEMTAQQKVEYERDNLLKEVEAYRKEKAMFEMSNTARGILNEAGITNLSDDILTVLVREDAETTSKAVNDFAKSFKGAVEKAVNERLKQPAPKKNFANGTLTKEDILKETDPIKRQELIVQNLELFE